MIEIHFFIFLTLFSPGCWMIYHSFLDLWGDLDWVDWKSSNYP